MSVIPAMQEAEVGESQSEEDKGKNTRLPEK
jgi:hypothetical protein